MKRKVTCGRLAFVLLASAVSVGCATNYAGVPSDELAAKMQVLDNDFSKSRAFVAPTVNGDGGSFGSPTYRAKLIAVQDKAGGPITHALDLQLTYVGRDWLFFSTVTLKGGTQLQTKVSDRTVSSCMTYCSYHETLMSMVPPEYLEYHLTNPGLDLVLRAGGQRGYVDFRLSGDYIRGYLEGVKRLALR